MSQLHKIASQFVSAGDVSAVAPLGNGNINNTFLVTVSGPSAGDALPAERFVLQQINTQIFNQPELVIHNMSVLSAHLQNHAQALPRRWEMPCILPTGEGHAFVVDESGGYWRAITFIEDSQVFEAIDNAAQAKEVGYGLAMFHRLISTLPAEQLADTLEGFHITPQYLAAYDSVLADWRKSHGLSDSLDSSDVSELSDAFSLAQLDGGQMGDRQADVQYCLRFIAERKDWAHVLENAKAAGHLALRPIHGDPKVNNIMFGANNQAVSLIDLDTLKPGLLHYDIGDCLRSGCNRLGEETKDWAQVTFDLELAQAMLEGYLSLARDFLTEQDYAYLYDGIRLIAFELGLRFFTDYLAGNVYFKVKHPLHNLDRALVQFQLTASIEAQAVPLKAMIDSLK